MDNVYRLFLASESHDDTILEWRFTKRDLDFLEHQYSQGVVSRQPGQSLSIVLGSVYEHSGEGIGSIFTEAVTAEQLGKTFHGDSLNHVQAAFRNHKETKVRSKDSSVKFSVKNGDLVIQIEAVKPGFMGDDQTSVTVPFSVLECLHEAFEDQDVDLENDWHRSEHCKMLMTPELPPLQEYEATLTKTIRLESRVCVLARSRDGASQKALNLNEQCQFYEKAQSTVLVDNVTLNQGAK